MRYEEFTIEGRNAVIEAFRSGKPIDKVFILDGCQDGPMVTIRREAKKKDVMIKYVTKERLDQMSETASIRASSPMRRLMNMRRFPIFWKKQKKREKIRLFLFWIILRIRTISVRS